jgi:molybdenum cofactor cytidylyltransferase
MSAALTGAPIRTVGVLLAAGVGHRFDAAHPGRKLEVLIDGVSVAERSLGSLAASTDAVVVVARSPESRFAQFAASRSHLVVFPELSEATQAGMGLSLACGASSVMRQFAGVTTIVIALADMPWVSPATVVTLVTHSQTLDAIVQPVYQGEKGHPVVFPVRYLDELAACSADVGAKNILRAHAANVRVIGVADAGVIRDVDVPQDINVLR